MPAFGTPSPEQIKILLTRAQREGMDPSVTERLSVILHFAEHHYSISETCRQFGISRSTFHRWMERFNPDDLTTLADKSHEPLSFRQSAIDQHTIELIRRYRMRYVQMGKERIAELLGTEHGIQLSPSSVGRVIERECLYFGDTPLHWKKRMANSRDAAEQPAAPAEAAGQHHHVPVLAEDADAPVQSSFGWKGLKRFVIVSSVVTNIAFVAMLLGMALLEHDEAPPNTDIRTETLHAAPSSDYLP